MNTSCRACRRYLIIINYVLISFQAAWIIFKISAYLSLFSPFAHDPFYKQEKRSFAWLRVSFKRVEGAWCQESEIFFQPTFSFLPSVVLKRRVCKTDKCNIHIVRRISLHRTRIPLLIPLRVVYFMYFVFRKIWGVFGSYNFVTHE